MTDSRESDSGQPVPTPYPILKYFSYGHLPEHLAAISAPFSGVAYWMADTLPQGPETAAGLRKLLEAKDCAVQPTWTQPRRRSDRASRRARSGSGTGRRTTSSGTSQPTTAPDLWVRVADPLAQGANTGRTLLGYAANEASAMDTATASGKHLLVLGDFNYFAIVDRIGMSIEVIPTLFGPTDARPDSAGSTRSGGTPAS